MRVLLDHNLPRAVRVHLRSHFVITAAQMSWDRLTNGDLLRVAEAEGFNVLLTGDQNIIYQQNNVKRKIALVVVSRTDRRSLVQAGESLREALNRATVGSFERVDIPRVPREPEKTYLK